MVRPELRAAMRKILRERVGDEVLRSLTLRIPERLRSQIEAEAQKNRHSSNKEIITRLEQSLCKGQGNSWQGPDVSENQVTESRMAGLIARMKWWKAR